MSRTVLLVTHHEPTPREGPPGGGRENLSALIHAALLRNYSHRLQVLTLRCAPIQGVSRVIGAFRGYFDGLDPDVIEEGMRRIEQCDVGKLFVDGSNLGTFARAARARFPHLQITTFCHNAEARFFAGQLRSSRSLRSAAVLAINYLAERRALASSTNVICLSERDDQMLRRLYGRGATHVCPLAIRDSRALNSGEQPPLATPFVLFVGGAFYANVEGVRWYAARVAPRLSVPTAVVGRGFEAYRSELHSPGFLEIVGEVADLSAWYRHAALVVAPIFDGSGMKTKVAEALMYGKAIVGTPEAFSGYENVLRRPDWVCGNADAFVHAIQDALHRRAPEFDPGLRALYERHYSLEAATTRLAEAMGPLV